MFILGITGGIGCGKSTAAAILHAHGIPVLDADKISHELTQSGGRAIPEIIDSFGPDFIDETGALNRSKMSSLVFNNRKELDRLSLIIHKHVMAEMKKRREDWKKAKEKICLMDVPVPVKDGFLDSCDQIWIIWSDEDIRIDRLKLRGMDENEAKRRMQLQMSEEEYAQLGEHVIMNNGSIRDLEQSLNVLIEKELLGRGIPVQLGFSYSNLLAKNNESESENKELDVETE